MDHTRLLAPAEVGEKTKLAIALLRSPSFLALLFLLASSHREEKKKKVDDDDHISTFLFRSSLLFFSFSLNFLSSPISVLVMQGINNYCIWFLAQSIAHAS